MRCSERRAVNMAQRHAARQWRAAGTSPLRRQQEKEAIAGIEVQEVWQEPAAKDAAR